MKKFILLFTMAIVSLTAVQAQQITKIYGKNALGNKPWVDFETDTLQYDLSSVRLGVMVFFAVTYQNGDIPLAQGDTIVLDFKIGVKSIFDFNKDSLHYVLNSPLAANDTLRIELNNIAEQLNLGFANSFTQIDNFRDKAALTATIHKTNKFPVTINKNKQITAYFLRAAGGTNSLTEKAIQNIQLFPNPVNSNLNITNLNNTKVEIFNVVGQRILTHDNANGNLDIDMTAYPNGIYFVKMQNGKSVRTEKIKLVK